MFTALSSGFNFVEYLFTSVIGLSWATFEEAGIFDLAKGLKTLIGLVK